MLSRLITIVVLLGCGTDTLPAGAVCNAADECEVGLSCLELGQFNEGTCTVVGKTCTTTCTDDAGCAALGANFKCFASCGADKVCGMVAGP